MLVTALLCAILAVCIVVIIFYMVPDIKAECKAIWGEACIDANEIQEAYKEVEIAKQQFNYAEQDFVDVAIYKMKAAEERYNTLLKIERGKQERESNISM